MADTEELLDESSAPGEPIAAIVPVRTERVQFYEDTILGAETLDGQIYIPLRPICDTLGLDWSAQRKRILRDTLLAEELETVQLGTEQGDRDMLCLPLNLIPGWLFGLSETRVREELQPKIKRYRRECFEVLWRAFRGNILAGRASEQPQTAAEKALAELEVQVEIARRQVELERRTAAVEAKQQTMADYLRGYIPKRRAFEERTEARLAGLELHVGSDATISEAQAAEIAGLVKLLAARLNARDGGKHHGQIYDSLYQRFAIASYRNLPRGEFDAARTWLQAQIDELDPPT